MIPPEQNLSFFCLSDAARLCAHRSTIPEAFVLRSKRLCSLASKMLCSQRSVVHKSLSLTFVSKVPSSLSGLRERGWRPLRRPACVTTPSVRPYNFQDLAPIFISLSHIDLDSLKTRAQKTRTLRFLWSSVHQVTFWPWVGKTALVTESRFRNQNAWGEPQVCHFLAVWPWETCLTSLCLNFLSCIKEVALLPVSELLRRLSEMFVKCLKQCLPCIKSQRRV